MENLSVMGSTPKPVQILSEMVDSEYGVRNISVIVGGMRKRIFTVMRKNKAEVDEIMGRVLQKAAIAVSHGFGNYHYTAGFKSRNDMLDYLRSQVKEATAELFAGLSGKKGDTFEVRLDDIEGMTRQRIELTFIEDCDGEAVYNELFNAMAVRMSRYKEGVDIKCRKANKHGNYRGAFTILHNGRPDSLSVKV